MIKVLDKNISDKIAAGEVVERPISIVKELVENSLDAGADSIVVEIKNGGKSYIRITDNGCGIPADEVETAFLRHATSKITSAFDLNSINTLGFRGEALASIAAVSRTEIITKPETQKLGHKLTIHGGEVIGSAGTGCPDGTTIVVTDLFYNTPARLKFLKTDSAESGLIIDFLSQIALAYKNIKIRLINNGKILFSTLGDGNRLNTIMRIYNNVDAANLVPVSHSQNGYTVDGYISTPAMSRTTRGSQIYFVNGRVINSRIIEKGVTLGYKERLFDGRYPVAYLFLTVNPSIIDVNIHPNKREIRFDDESFVVGFISEAIKKALSTKDAIVDAGNIFKAKGKNLSSEKVYERVFGIFRDDDKDEKTESRAAQQQFDIKELLSSKNNPSVVHPEHAPEADSEYNTKGKAVADAEDVTAGEYVTCSEDIKKPEGKIPAQCKESPAGNQMENLVINAPAMKPFNFDELAVIGTIFDTYIAAADQSNFYLIDQHAAHERVFYEKLVSEYNETSKSKQPIMVPFVINVPLSSSVNRSEWENVLVKMGFSIEEFGQNTYRVSEIPMFMKISEAEDFINEYIENISDRKYSDITNTVVIDKLITMSCKAAVKANDVLKNMEITELIKELSHCVNPFSCPHGRPTFIKLSHYEIQRMFKRV